MILRKNDLWTIEVYACEKVFHVAIDAQRANCHIGTDGHVTCCWGRLVIGCRILASSVICILSLARTVQPFLLSWLSLQKLLPLSIYLSLSLSHVVDTFLHFSVSIHLYLEFYYLYIQKMYIFTLLSSYLSIYVYI